MKRLNINVGDDHNVLLDKISKSYDVSKSDVIRDALNDYFKNDKLKFNSIKNSKTNLTKSLLIKITNDMYELLKNVSKLNNNNISSEVRFRLISSLIDEPVLVKNEIEKLDKNYLNLLNIGKNINHIAKAILSENYTSSSDLTNILDDLFFLLDENKKILSNLEKVSIDRFSYRG